MAGPEDFATLVHELVQQQSAFGQQQAALLQLQAETVRLQRLLIERALGPSGADIAVALLAGSSIRAELEPQVPASEVILPDLQSIEHVAPPVPSTAPAEDKTLPIAEAPEPVESGHPPGEHEDSLPGNAPQNLVRSTPASADMPAPAAAAPQPPSTLRAARYLQPSSAKATGAVTRQEVERLSRLHEAGEAAHLVLQFGL